MSRVAGVFALLLIGCPRPPPIAQTLIEDAGAEESGGGRAEEAVFVAHDPKLALVETCETPDVPEAGVVHEAHDVTYATIGGEALKLDIAWPMESGVHPLVVIIHGGGWSAGTRMLYEKDTRRLATIGYVAATIDYRLSNKPKNVFPAGVQDVRCAVRWLRSKAETYGIDRRRVVALGVSAGGHLAAMLAVARDELAIDDVECPVRDQTVGVSAAVAYYGAYDLRTPSTTYSGIMVQGTKEFLAAVAEDAPEIGRAASPIAHVDSGDPPMLLLHGEEDVIIPIGEARRFRDALVAAGVPVLVREVAGGRHGFPILVTTRPGVTCTTLGFLRAVVGDL